MNDAPADQLPTSEDEPGEEALRATTHAVGLLTGEAAHDINNLLTVITSHVELLLQSVSDRDQRESLNEIKKAGERSAVVTRQLLAFSRTQVAPPRVLVLNDVVQEVEKTLRCVIGPDVQLFTNLRASSGSIKANAEQLEQILLNLAVNARDAMPHGGSLTIETTNVVLDEEHAAVGPERGPGPYVLLTMTDSGSGLTELVKRHMFEPFFTTKGPGEGTGLGLAVVSSLVAQSGGHIEVDSQQGVGTTFSIYLPRVVSAAASLPVAARTREVAGGTETVLVVEDEEVLRNLARTVLKRYGYVVLTACDGQDALAITADRDMRIDLLLTDVVMPGLGGRALADQLIASHPAMKVLYMSGYTADAVTRYGVGQDNHFLQKPFSATALAEKVRAVLTGRPRVSFR